MYDYRRTREREVLDDLPVGTTIAFFQGGKERYLRKIRPTPLYPHPWYSMEMDVSIPNDRVPRGWSVLILARQIRQGNNNAQRTGTRHGNLCGTSQY